MSLPRYPEYKDSGVAWLQELPAHWVVTGARRLFDEKRDASLEGDEQLSATQRYGVIPQRLFMHTEDQKVVLALSGTSNFKHVEPDDFVISLRSFQGGIEHSNYAGCVSPAYTVLRANKPIAPRYWAYTLKSSSYISALQTVTAGIREGKNISYDQFGSLELPVPSLEEQLVISNMLDTETAKIDALIAEQEKLLSLMAEKRQATISHAVTRGLDRSVPMKDSGIAWLGEVPAHWEACPLKYVSHIGNGSTPSRDHPGYWAEVGYPWLNSSVVNQEEVTEATQFVTDLALKECHLPIVRPPAVLVGITGQGKTRGMAAPLMFEATINQHLAYIKPTLSRLSEVFLLRVIQAAYAHLRTASDSAGSTKGAITCDQLARLGIPVPPMQEQHLIKTYLDDAAGKFDDLVREAEIGIALLRERRSALIAAAVTGKVDVRGLAA
jgi:type I restriction enzyme S subunit